MEIKSNKSKTNHKKGIAAAAKARRRAEAVVRQATYAAVPLERKLATAGKKEKAKLLARGK